MELSDRVSEAFIYGYASVDLQRILARYALDPTSPEFKAPVNAFGHARRLADPSDRSIVAMNVDTPYSYAWLDLRSEPVILTIPPFEADRYVSAMLVDLATYIVGYVSPRTNGHAGGRFLVTGPGAAQLHVPDLTGAFRVPTDLALVLLRTQLLDKADLPRVHAIQDGCLVAPLSAALGTSAPLPSAPLVAPSPVDVRGAPDLGFMVVLDWTLTLMPVQPGEEELRERLLELGLGTGRWSQPTDPPTREAWLVGMGQGMARIAARARTVRSSGELFGSREHLGADHLSRATGAMLGILGNAEEEYLGVGYQGDADGHPFDGHHAYRIRFAPGGLPPVGAFWSITLYDADRFLYPNPLGRSLIGSRQVPGLVRDPDGSITLLVQHTAPDPALVPNWLPCPDGPFHLAARTYLPGPAIRDGSWTAPPVQRMD